MKIFKELLSYGIIIIVVILIRSYIITPAIVNGDSMYPNLKNKQVLLVKKYDKKIERFDIIVLNYNKERLVKRVIGLPGEHVSYIDNKLYINGTLVEEKFLNDTTNDFDIKILGYEVIPEGFYFVMGDNRNNSKDSRIVGLIHINDIVGTTNYRIFPINKFGKI